MNAGSVSKMFYITLKFDIMAFGLRTFIHPQVLNYTRLELFVDISGSEESWRFFRMDGGCEHFVVFPTSES